jgi:hypothetical protein
MKPAPGLATALRRPVLALASLVALATLAWVGGASAPSAAAAPVATRVFELRTYHAAEGKIDALHARFRDHTLELFAKHGLEVIGFWVPQEEGDSHSLTYLLAFPSNEARQAAWAAFAADPEWKEVAAESQKDGKLLTKIDSTMFDPTDYSPMQ